MPRRCLLILTAVLLCACETAGGGVLGPASSPDGGELDAGHTSHDAGPSAPDAGPAAPSCNPSFIYRGAIAGQAHSFAPAQGRFLGGDLFVTGLTRTTFRSRGHELEGASVKVYRPTTSQPVPLSVARDSRPASGPARLSPLGDGLLLTYPGPRITQPEALGVHVSRFAPDEEIPWTSTWLSSPADRFLDAASSPEGVLVAFANALPQSTEITLSLLAPGASLEGRRESAFLLDPNLRHFRMLHAEARAFTAVTVSEDRLTVVDIDVEQDAATPRVAFEGASDIEAILLDRLGADLLVARQRPGVLELMLLRPEAFAPHAQADLPLPEGAQVSLAAQADQLAVAVFDPEEDRAAVHFLDPALRAATDGPYIAPSTAPRAATRMLGLHLSAGGGEWGLALTYALGEHADSLAHVDVLQFGDCPRP